MYENPNSGLRETFACGMWNVESLNLESGIQLKESGIPLTIRIQNPSTTDKESGIQCLESAFQDCLVKFPYMGREIEYTPARSLS